jgi:hypothetical protein
MIMGAEENFLGSFNEAFLCEELGLDSKTAEQFQPTKPSLII